MCPPIIWSLPNSNNNTLPLPFLVTCIPLIVKYLSTTSYRTYVHDVQATISYAMHLEKFNLCITAVFKYLLYQHKRTIYKIILSYQSRRFSFFKRPTINYLLGILAVQKEKEKGESSTNHASNMCTYSYDIGLLQVPRTETLTNCCVFNTMRSLS